MQFMSIRAIHGICDARVKSCQVVPRMPIHANSCHACDSCHACPFTSIRAIHAAARLKFKISKRHVTYTSCEP
eukprot:6353624-Lingulodinium_polyedra.AAC.1